MADGLIAIIIAAGAICALICLVGGILRLMEKLECLRSSRRRREVIDAIKLFKATERRVPGELTAVEYDRAIRIVIRKYHMANRSGGLDTHGQDSEYISMLIAEAVGQARILQGTLKIARAGRELENDDRKEVITA